MRRFRFSLKVTLICGTLIALMVRASCWQWQRHLQKTAIIEELGKRLALPVEPIGSHLGANSEQWAGLVHRRFQINCTFDFEHEMILKNRRYGDRPGAFVLTPCKMSGNAPAVLVSRGFIPYAFMERDKRKVLWRNPETSFIGLVKESTPRKFLSPEDEPAGTGHAWVDGWLRVDIENIQKQIPYPLLPVYVEVMGDQDLNATATQAKIVNSTSERDDMFLMTKEKMVAGREQELGPEYPIPVYDPVVSAGRHLGYVFEWAGMALITFCIGLILQFRRPKAEVK